jgi:hypothetical protein
MQNEQPLHLSSRTTISTSLGLDPWGADIGRRAGLAGETSCPAISAAALNSLVMDASRGLLEINLGFAYLVCFVVSYIYYSLLLYPFYLQSVLGSN